MCLLGSWIQLKLPYYFSFSKQIIKIGLPISWDEFYLPTYGLFFSDIKYLIKMSRRVFSVIVLLLFSVISFSQEKNQITYIANSGVFIEYNDIKVFIDALHKEYDKLYQETKRPYPRSMVNGTTPFEHIDLFMITHMHGDHFDSDYMIDFLTKHEECILVAPQQVIDTMGSVPQLAVQVYSLHDQDKGLMYEMDGMKITSIPMIHSYPEKNYWVRNMAYLIDFDGLTILHMGDAELTEENFNRIQEVTGGKVDYALMPYWLFYDEGKQWSREKIGAKKYIAIHIPTNKTGTFESILKREVVDADLDLNVFIRIGEFETIQKNEEN